MRRKSSGFMVIELMAVLLIFVIIFVICWGIYNETSRACVEYEEVPVMDCYNWGHHTTCESYTTEVCKTYE